MFADGERVDAARHYRRKCAVFRLMFGRHSPAGNSPAVHAWRRRRCLRGREIQARAGPSGVTSRPAVYCFRLHRTMYPPTLQPQQPPSVLDSSTSPPADHYRALQRTSHEWCSPSLRWEPSAAQQMMQGPTSLEPSVSSVE